MGRMRKPLLAVLLALAAVPAAQARPLTDDPPPPPLVDPPIAWQPSTAVGKPFHGRLVDGVQLPAEGVDFWTYDWGLRTTPNRAWRRWGTDRLIRTLLAVLREYRTANPAAPRVGVADLSRPHGGSFGEHFGGLGHDSHQNGLDVDVLYPRADGLERRAWCPELVDRRLAQDLVNRFVTARAVYVFTGPRVHLSGPHKVVVKLVHHDDHMHVRVR
jgi:murein endopeptidase